MFGGLEPFTSPFQLIAADANGSGSVTTFDIVEIRKVILGINSTMVTGSWRYVPEYCFENQGFSDDFYADPFTAIWTNPDEPNGLQREYSGGSSLPNATSWMDHVSINPAAATAHEVEPWSLWGVKTGDVNCTSMVEEFTLPPDETFLTPGHALLSTNQEFILQIRTFSNTPVSAWQFGIEFDEEYLQVLEVLQGNSGEAFSPDNFGLTQASAGKFRALSYEPAGAATNLDNKILFKIRVKALQSIASIGQHFHLKNRILEFKFYDSDGNEIENIDLQLEIADSPSGMMVGNEGIKNTASAEKYRLSVHPIPVTSEVVFDFYLPEEEQVHLLLYDGLGHIVGQKKLSLSKGANSCKLDNLANQPAGFYWYLFKAGDQSLYGKLIKN